MNLEIKIFISIENEIKKKIHRKNYWIDLMDI